MPGAVQKNEDLHEIAKIDGYPRTMHSYGNRLKKNQKIHFQPTGENYTFNCEKKGGRKNKGRGGPK